MTTRNVDRAWAIALVMAIIWSIGPPGVSPAHAAVESPLVLVDRQHVDIEVPIIGGMWTPSVRAWYDGNLPAERALLIFNRNTRTVRDTWELWIGAADGQTVWIAEQGSVPEELWLGLAARGCDQLGIWLPDDSRLSVAFQYIQIDLIDVRGYDGDDNPVNNPPAPGYFSMWETDSWGAEMPWFSTAEALADGNRTYMIPGGHAHFNWAFTAEGIYEVDLQPRAYLGPGQTNLSVGPVTTFYFGVERPVPGDANLDDEVDADDAVTLATHWGTSGETISWLEGDFDADGTIGPADASILAANWGFGTGEATAMPEPGTAALLIAGAILCLVARCRRGSFQLSCK